MRSNQSDIHDTMDKFRHEVRQFQQSENGKLRAIGDLTESMMALLSFWETYYKTLSLPDKQQLEKTLTKSNILLDKLISLYEGSHKQDKISLTEFKNHLHKCVKAVCRQIVKVIRDEESVQKAEEEALKNEKAIATEKKKQEEALKIDLGNLPEQSTPHRIITPPHVEQRLQKKIQLSDTLNEKIEHFLEIQSALEKQYHLEEQKKWQQQRSQHALSSSRRSRSVSTSDVSESSGHRSSFSDSRQSSISSSLQSSIDPSESNSIDDENHESQKIWQGTKISIGVVVAVALIIAATIFICGITGGIAVPGVAAGTMAAGFGAFGTTAAGVIAGIITGFTFLSSAIAAGTAHLARNLYKKSYQENLPPTPKKSMDALDRSTDLRRSSYLDDIGPMLSVKFQSRADASSESLLKTVSDAENKPSKPVWQPHTTKHPENRQHGGSSAVRCGSGRRNRR